MNRRTVLKGGLVLAAASHTAVAVSDFVDQDLLNLGREFENAFAEEEAARTVGRATGNWDAWDSAYERTGGIVERIEELPASSVEGLRVKARCIQWCYGDDPVEIGEHSTTDMRFVNQIIQSLLKSANPAASAA